jgi:hypothetical protein
VVHQLPVMSAIQSRNCAKLRHGWRQKLAPFTSVGLVRMCRGVTPNREANLSKSQFVPRREHSVSVTKNSKQGSNHVYY